MTRKVAQMGIAALALGGTVGLVTAHAASAATGDETVIYYYDNAAHC